MRYVTVTPNPCFDLTLRVGDFVFDDPNRVYEETVQSAGKGVNVSLVFAAHGLDVATLMPAGRDNFARYAAGLPQELGLRAVLMDGAVRENMTVCSDDGKIVKLNRRGAAYTPQAHGELLDLIRQTVRDGDHCVICGSLPPAMTNAQLLEAAKTAADGGARVSVDTDGLSREVLHAMKPFVIKPNHVELARLFGKERLDESECREAALELVADGVQNVAVSLGGDGLLLVNARQQVRVGAPQVAVVSTVSAGDSALAGLLMHCDEDIETAARWAAAYGSAAVMQPGSTVGDRETAARLFEQIHAV